MMQLQRYFYFYRITIILAQLRYLPRGGIRIPFENLRVRKGRFLRFSFSGQVKPFFVHATRAEKGRKSGILSGVVVGSVFGRSVMMPGGF